MDYAVATAASGTPTTSSETQSIVEALDDANVGNIYHNVDLESRYSYLGRLLCPRYHV